MSSAETVRAFYAAVNGDGGADEAVGLLSEDVRWHRPPDVPLTGTLEGVEAVRKMFRAFGEPLERFQIEPDELREVGDAIVVPVTFRGVPVEGRPFAFSGAQVFVVADGRISSVREFKTLDEGLAAASEGADER
jgi:ketosteroid isomerase-like protein